MSNKKNNNIIIKNIIELDENNLLSFGNYESQEKLKLDNFEFDNNIYKVKTHDLITRLEKNNNMILETTPGTSIHKLDLKNNKQVSFYIYGYKNTEITLMLNFNQDYNLYIDQDDLGIFKSSEFGKFSFSLDLELNKSRFILIKEI